MLSPDEREEIERLKREVDALKYRFSKLSDAAVGQGPGLAHQEEVWILAATLRGAFHANAAVLNLMAAHAMFKAFDAGQVETINRKIEEITASMNAYMQNLKRFPDPPGGTIRKVLPDE